VPLLSQLDLLSRSYLNLSTPRQSSTPCCPQLCIKGNRTHTQALHAQMQHEGPATPASLLNRRLC
jgi:hypothetical protein